MREAEMYSGKDGILISDEANLATEALLSEYSDNTLDSA